MAWRKMKYTETRMEADGTGYIRDEEGRYRYGNQKYGFRLTREEQRKDAQRLEEQAKEEANRRNNSSGVVAAAGTYSGGGSLLGFLATVAVSAVAFGAMMAFCVSFLFVGMIVAAVTVPLIVWPEYIDNLASNYTAGTIDWAVILVTAIIAFLAIYFLYCVLIISIRKSMRSKRFIIVCTIAITVLHSVIDLLAFRSLAFSSVLEYAFNGLLLSILPSFILCFVEHLATKKLRGDNEWFITKISKIISKVYIKNDRGMVTTGILSVVFGVLLLFASIDAFMSKISVAFLIFGVLFAIMGRLARNK